MESVEHDAWRRDTIRRHGWALEAVAGDEDAPPFVYTVGLSGLGHPELILFATAPPTAAAVLNGLGELVRAGRRLGPLEQVTVRGGAVHLLDFPRVEDWLLAAEELYGGVWSGPVRALLVVPAGDLVVSPV